MSSAHSDFFAAGSAAQGARDAFTGRKRSALLTVHRQNRFCTGSSPQSWESSAAFRGPPATHRPPPPPPAGRVRYATRLRQFLRLRQRPEMSADGTRFHDPDTLFHVFHKGDFQAHGNIPRLRDPRYNRFRGYSAHENSLKVSEPLRLDQSRLCLLSARLPLPLQKQILCINIRAGVALKSIIGKCSFLN